MNRICTFCERILPLTSFHKDNNKKHGRQFRCKECKNFIYRNKTHVRINERAKHARFARRSNVFSHYDSKCECCGETNYEFLTIDHINGGGKKHREEIGKNSAALYKWLMDNNYPPGFRVLCYNCNISHGHFGYCPHKSKSWFLTKLEPILNQGENHVNAKLTKEQVLEIYYSKLGSRTLAKKFSIDRTSIQRIKSGISWKSVTNLA